MEVKLSGGVTTMAPSATGDWCVWVRERGGLWAEVSSGLSAAEAQRFAERVQQTDGSLLVRVKLAGHHPSTQRK